MLERYHNYMMDNDYKRAGEVIEKFHHFFPKYKMGDYFNAVK